MKEITESHCNALILFVWVPLFFDTLYILVSEEKEKLPEVMRRTADECVCSVNAATWPSKKL